MPRSLRRSVMMVVFFLTGALMLQVTVGVALAPPAAAEASDIGGGIGGAGGHGGTPSLTVRCGAGNTGTANGLPNYYLAPFPLCWGHQFVNQIAFCPVGFDVWRFYGTKSNPAAYTSVSRVNLDNWCQENRTYRYFLPNPQDSGSTAGGPWRAAEYTNPYGERVAVADGSYVTSDYPTRYLVNGEDSGAQTCANLHTNTDEISRYFRGSFMDRNSPDYQAGSVVRQGFLNLYKRWAVRIGPTIALTAINSGFPYPNGNGNGDDIRYDDGIPCSSTLDFATPVSNPDPVVMGECVMPISRLARVYTGGNYAFYNIAYNSVAGATRYTNEYAGSAATQRGGAFENWRGMIAHEIRTRPEVGGIPGSGGIGVNVPAQPYDFNTGGTIILSQVPTANREASANAAANGAFCFSGAAATYSGETGGQAGNVATHVLIKLKAPESFQVGGSLKPGTVTTEAATLMCGTRACNNARNPLDPTLNSLTYTLNLEGVNFRSCTNKKYSSGCEYYIEVPAKANNNGQTVTGWFYSGTNPNQKVQIKLNNVSATQQVYRQTNKDLTTCLPSSSLGSNGNQDVACERIQIVQNLKDGPPRAVGVRVDANGKIMNVPSNGVILEKNVIGATGVN